MNRYSVFRFQPTQWLCDITRLQRTARIGYCSVSDHHCFFRTMLLSPLPDMNHSLIRWQKLATEYLKRLEDRRFFLLRSLLCLGGKSLKCPNYLQW